MVSREPQELRQEPVIRLSIYCSFPPLRGAPEKNVKTPRIFLGKRFDCCGREDVHTLRGHRGELRHVEFDILSLVPFKQIKQNVFLDQFFTSLVEKTFLAGLKANIIRMAFHLFKPWVSRIATGIKSSRRKFGSKINHQSRHSMEALTCKSVGILVRCVRTELVKRSFDF